MRILNREEINDIYHKHVKINYTQEYINRYNPLPLEYNNKNWKWENKDVPRIPALLEFRRYSEKYNFNFKKVLSFNGQTDPEYEYLKYDYMYNCYYEDNSEKYDLHNLQLDQNDFDFVMLNQTIEHLYNPFLCIDNLYKYLKTGGYLYANVPSNNIPHSTPEHYYTGITPVGLGVMMKSSGFEILEIGQWGNKNYLNYIFKMNNWGDINYSSNPCINDLDCPLITWILVKK